MRKVIDKHSCEIGSAADGSGHGGTAGQETRGKARQERDRGCEPKHSRPAALFDRFLVVVSADRCLSLKFARYRSSFVADAVS